MDQFKTYGDAGYAISELQLFRGVNEKNVGELLADCQIEHVAAGKSLSNSGNKSPRLYIVLRGALQVTADAQSGVAEGTKAKVLPGECVGELAVLDQETNSTHMSALEDTELLVIEAEKLWKLIDESNGVARNLLHLLSFRVRAANAQLRSRHKVGEFYRQLSMVDGLTQLHNRAWLNDNLQALIASAHDIRNPLSVIMIDLDHFKKFNDEHGHLAGDNALRTAAKVLIDTLRPRDFAVRYGGEELLVILPNTNRKAGAVVAQRLCDHIQNAVVFADMRKALPHITASFGLAFLAIGQDAEGLIAAADDALYRAKRGGRNQVAQ